MDLAEILRGRDTSSVGALASELGVSRRTLLRDLATLRERGLPIAGDSGPGGGVRLLGDRGVTAVHLSLSEIVTLWLAARLSQAASDLPWGYSASAALAKLLGSLPAPRARELKWLCRRVVVGPPASAAVLGTMANPPKELLRVFEEAFSDGLGLSFDYSDRYGNKTRRRVEPHGLLVQSPVWYVLGRDVVNSHARMFRMDRIMRPRVARDLAFRPDARVIWQLLPPEVNWRPLLGERT